MTQAYRPRPAATAMTNLRAALFMTAAMALFAVEDMFMKFMTEDLPVGQVLVMTGGIATALFWALIAARGGRLWTRALLDPAIMARNIGEGVGAVMFVAALSQGDLATASAILQAVPLAITLGAVLFLRETVGWRRWLSIILGMVGVLIVVRPGTGAFQPASLLAVGAVVMLSLRDLATRRVPAGVSSTVLTASAFAAMVPAGLVWLLIESRVPLIPGAAQMGMAAGAVAFGLTAYMLMVAALRMGEIAVVAPFRYTRLLFAMVLAVVVFGERPDAMTLLGAGVIAAAGGYAMAREARLARRPR